MVGAEVQGSDAIPMIEGETSSLGKAEVAAAIARVLGIPKPKLSNGGTVTSDFLDDIIAALGSSVPDEANAYRRFEHVLSLCGEIYDPTIDSSEATRSGGGSTITAPGYRKLLRGITAEPRCFIFNIADHPVSSIYRDVPGRSYGFTKKVSGRRPLLEAGVGSEVVFYRTQKASIDPRMAFVATAVIESLQEPAPGEFRAYLVGYREFRTPVPESQTSIQGWNRQHGIAEISHDTFEALVDRGNGNIEKRDHAKRPGPRPGRTIRVEPAPGGNAGAAINVADLVPIESPLDLLSLIHI